jgi:hypothetical protein
MLFHFVDFILFVEKNDELMKISEYQTEAECPPAPHAPAFPSPMTADEGECLE